MGNKLAPDWCQFQVGGLYYLGKGVVLNLDLEEISKQPSLTLDWPKEWVPEAGKLYELSHPDTNEKLGPVFIINVFECNAKDFVWLEAQTLLQEQIVSVSISIHSIKENFFYSLLVPTELLES